METRLQESYSEPELLRAALFRASAYGAREVRFTAEGVFVKDGLGARRELTRHGQPVRVDMATFGPALESQEFRSYNYTRWSDEEREISGLGNWLLTEDGEGFSMRPKKTKAPCLDPLLEVEGDGLGRLRSLYRRGGMDVIFMCEGDTRTREIALALSAERCMLGLPTSVSLMPEQTYRRDDDEKQFGPVLFDSSASEAGEPWAVEQVEGKKIVDLFLKSENVPETRVFAASASPHEIRRFGMVQDHLDKRGRPAAVVMVTLVKSKPVARFMFSPALMDESTPDSTFADAPWDIYAEKKAARLKSRPAAPKTWHPTTESVAEAFVARIAPRGYVSSKSLYFHGPVAFAAYDANPVAAIVDLPGNKTAIFYGRQGGIGGTLAGTVSMAQGDVGSAVRRKGGFIEFHVRELSEFLTLGDMPLDQMARRFRNAKDESEHPAGCRVDRKKLRAYLSRALEECETELDRAMKTDFATYTKANAYRSLQRLAEMRDSLAGLLNANLPDVGNADEYRVWADTETAAANSRQVEIRERRKAADEEPVEASSPSM